MIETSYHKAGREEKKNDMSDKKIIEGKDLTYSYTLYDDEGKPEAKETALDGVDLFVERGQFIAVLGHNGSGKSTLARHLNALLVPDGGTLFVNGFDTRDEMHLWEIRQSAGMVFQNPDNQIIASVVEEDVGFGPENMGVPTEEIWRRVEEALKKVGMWEERTSSPDRLSGGQKQRVAIAGVIAMKPECIVLDEPTAMLDPAGRSEVIKTVRELNEKEKVTIILITHNMEETIHADRILVMDHGKIVMSGSAREIFSQVEKLQSLRLGVPQPTLLAWKLKQKGLRLPDGILTVEELADALEASRLQGSIAEGSDGTQDGTPQLYL